MYYDRKIKYFDYIKDGQRIKGAGFLKIEVRDSLCDMFIQISGLHTTDTFSRQVYLVTEEEDIVLCELALQGGRAERKLRLRTDNIANGVKYQEIQALRIPIAAGYELFCRIAEKNSLVYEKVSAVSKEEVQVQEMADVEPETNAVAQEADTAKRVRIDADSNSDVMKCEVSEKKQEELSGEREVVAQEYKKEPAEHPRKRMLEDKWAQISAIYPRVNPFEDEREYLKLGPEDFVILNNRFYKLVHNSFLLHGYYNYQHLILTHMERRGETYYYIGVPGNFYEREKQVALMFGFESFECRNEPATPGDFGYYMIRVEL